MPSRHQPSASALLARAVLAGALALSGATAQAAYPDKPVRIIVTFSPGGASDIVARAIADPLAKALGQPVVVENKPGAGGTIGGGEVVRAAPDGYTLLLSNSTPLSIGPYTVPKQPYDPVRQFTHVAMLGIAPVAIMANPKSGPATLKDLPKMAAKGDMVFGSGGPGSIGHIVGEMAKKELGFEMTHVPYRGGAPMTADLLSGTLPVGIDVITAYAPMMKAGQLRGLAVTSRTRSALAPEVPTVLELGLPKLLAENYFGVSGPAGLPKEVIETLSKALAEIVADPVIVRRFGELGVTPVKMNGPEFTAFVAAQSGEWAPVIKAADMK